MIAEDEAFREGLTFTVFDIYNNKRILPRRPGLRILDLVEVALSLTPQIRRPWGHRIQEHTWPDLPMPQIVIWGALEPGHRVIPVRDCDQPDLFCTVVVTADASPLRILIVAGEKCNAFANARIQVARRERFFFADRHMVPAFEAHAAQGTHIGELQATEVPSLPRQQPQVRWRARFQPRLDVLHPGSSEDLWPVTEVVVHSQHRAPCRLQLPFNQDSSVLLLQAREVLGTTPNSGWRLPTHCPAEIGCPLHLFLFEVVPWDPWNDPREEDAPAWGLIDLRRIGRPPRPDYVMIELPVILDLNWIRQRIAGDFPDMAQIAAAFMGDEPITAACSPWGTTPLITLFPRSRYAAAVPGMADAILDTHSLLNLRTGWHRFPFRPPVDRPPPVLSQAAPPRSDARHPHAPRAGPTQTSIVRSVLEPTFDDDLADYVHDGLACEEVLVFQPGEPPQEVSISHLLPPQQFFAAVARAVGFTTRCTLHVPTLGPLVPGHLPSVIVLPPQCAGQRYVLVDARRVAGSTVPNFWIQEAPHVLSPTIAIAMLRELHPALPEIGAFFVDSISMRGYIELTTRTTLLTILPADYAMHQMPNPLFNSRTLRQRIGFVQRDQQLHSSFSTMQTATSTTTGYLFHAILADQLPVAETSTSTSTTSVPNTDRAALLRSSPDVRGSFVMTLNGKFIRFHVASPSGHVEIAGLHGDAPIEAIMTQLCVQLNDVGCLCPELRFRACERVICDTDWEYSVFFCTKTDDLPGTAWIDARPMGLPPFVVTLPFELTDNTLRRACGVVVPFDACVAVSGTPWLGRPQQLQHCDVVSIRANTHELFTLPLAALNTRVPGIPALLVQHIAPGFPIPVRDLDNVVQPLGDLLNGYTLYSIQSHWELVHLSCSLAFTNEGDYQQCVLVAGDIPPFSSVIGTRVAPTESDVNLWYSTWLRPVYGRRWWQSTGLAFGDLSVFFDCSLDATNRRPWIVCVDEYIDVIIAGPQGEGLDSWPAPEGWVLRPIFAVGPVGQAAYQRITTPAGNVFHMPPPVSALDPYPGASDSSDEFDPPDPFLPSWEALEPAPEVVSIPGSPDVYSVTEAASSDPEDHVVLVLPEQVDIADDEEATSLIQHSTKVQFRDVQQDVEETTPWAKKTIALAIPTPCGRAKIPLQHRPVQSRARTQQTAEQVSVAAHALSACASASTAIPINLDQCIPRTIDNDARCHTKLKVGVTADDFVRIFQPFGLTAFCPDMTAVSGVHANTAEELSRLPRWVPSMEVHCVRLYVDGSFFDATKQAGWAVVATACVDEQWHWVGFLSGQLHPPGHALHLGQTVVSPHTAELVALAYALAVAVRLPDSHCEIFYDATSAASIAEGVATSKHQHTLMHALYSLHYLASIECRSLRFTHIHSHQGHAYNEAADVIAKDAATHRFSHDPNATDFASAIRVRCLDWLWWTMSPHFQLGVLPGLNEDGHTLPTRSFNTRRHNLESIPGIPSTIVRDRTGPALPVTWHMRLATYNCTTITRECDRQCLADCFARDALVAIGLQETRTNPGPRGKQGPFACFCSAAKKGNFGCQLWVSTHCPLVTEEASAVYFEPEKAVIVASTPRLLTVTIPAGGKLFAFVVGHVPLPETNPVEAEEWWKALDHAFRQIPRRALPILFLDANARFCDSGATGTAVDNPALNTNAMYFQQFLSEHQLETCHSRNMAGQPVISWVSPHGNPAHLDFVAFPAELLPCAQTVGLPPSFVDPIGFDHRPVEVDLRWISDATATPHKWQWDRKKLRSPEGKAKVKEAFDSCPAILWETHPDDHLQCINDHLFTCLHNHFLQPPARPRKHHVSDELWQAMRSRRHCRRIVFRNKVLWRQHLACLLLKAWKSAVRPPDCAHSFKEAQDRWPTRCRSLRLANARLALVIRALTGLIRQLDRRDAAAFTRKALRQSRQEGSAELATTLRSVLKQGRRYKPPGVTPALTLSGQVVADPLDILHGLEDAFSRPENGTYASIRDISHVHPASSQLEVVDMASLPSLPDIAAAFIRQKSNKAAGLSTFPAELYSAAAIEAAALHIPLIAKLACSGVMPFLWKGSQAVALPKPGKMPGTLSAWRNIALYDAAAKGVGKALRQHLAQFLNNVTAPGQNGSLPGDTILLPAQHIQAYLATAAKCNRSGAILFIDGKSAYYSVIRQALFSTPCDGDVPFLQDLFQRLQFTSSQQSALLALMQGPGALEQAGTPTALQQFLQDSMTGTWFTMGDGCGAQPIVHTKSGTVPGTPLADLLFAFVQAGFQSAVKQDMAEAGLVVKFAHNGREAPMPSWADDVSIMLPFCAPDQLVGYLATATAIVEHRSRQTGICLNFERGKTEALCMIRGKGSRETRRRLLQGDQPTIDVRLHSEQVIGLRLVESYVHLGSVVVQSASLVPDVKAKTQSATVAFTRLKKTLLRNPELTTCEKVELVRALIISKLTFGAALWTPRTNAEQHAVNAALIKFWRSAFRPITCCSPIFLSDADVCRGLGTLTPDQFMRTERVRQLALVLQDGPSSLWDSLLIEGHWIDLAVTSLKEMCDALSFRFERELPADKGVCLTFLRAHHVTIARLPRRYTRFALDNCDGSHVLAAAKRRTDKERHKWEAVTLPKNGQGQHRCPICHKCFATKAAAASHQTARHRVSQVSDTVSGSVCHVCNQQWWTTYRLKEHLRRSSSCRNAWNHADLCDPLPFEPTGHRQDKA